MAGSTITIERILCGLSLALVIVLSLGTLCAVALRADAGAGLQASDYAAIRFTVLQAVLSSGISCLLAIPVGRALARRNFVGRSILITLLGAPFILPVIVAILGILSVFGQSGLLAAFLEMLGLPAPRIYGLHGVVLAHVFFNLPLATRLLLQGWLSIPAERFRVAACLGFTSRETMLHLEWPMLRSTLPGALALIFLICLTSFAVALVLGGGPKATTVELAIYHAFVFEFDLGRAAMLALVQFALAGITAVLAWHLFARVRFGPGLDRATERWDAQSISTKLFDLLFIVSSTAFLLMPVGMVVLNGLMQFLSLPGSVFMAAGRSLVVALTSVVLMLFLVLPIVQVVARSRHRTAGLVEGAGMLMIAASPLVMGTGLFILLYPVVDPGGFALAVTAVVNAAASLPFALRILVPAARAIEDDYGRLADCLDMSGLARLRFMTIPRLRRSLGFAMGVTAALSMGDLGVIALFNTAEFPTLPLMLYRLMGAYRMDDAAGAALLLLLLSLVLFWLFDRGGRMHAAT